MGSQSEAVATYEPEPESEPSRSELWLAVDRMLASMNPDAALAHGLAPLAADRLMKLGQPVPPRPALEARAAQLIPMMVAPVLERARAAYDGRILIVKGPEIAARYPPGTRLYGDLDVLVEDAAAAREALLAAGFETMDERIGRR